MYLLLKWVEIEWCINCFGFTSKCFWQYDQHCTSPHSRPKEVYIRREDSLKDWLLSFQSSEVWTKTKKIEWTFGWRLISCVLKDCMRYWITDWQIQVPYAQFIAITTTGNELKTITVVHNRDWSTSVGLKSNFLILLFLRWRAQYYCFGLTFRTKYVQNAIFKITPCSLSL